MDRLASLLKPEANRALLLAVCPQTSDSGPQRHRFAGTVVSAEAGSRSFLMLAVRFPQPAEMWRRLLRAVRSSCQKTPAGDSQLPSRIVIALSIGSRTTARPILLLQRRPRSHP